MQMQSDIEQQGHYRTALDCMVLPQISCIGGFNLRRPPVAAGGIGADQRLCELVMLRHVGDLRLALGASEGGQVQLRPHFTAPRHRALRQPPFPG